jgi:hypothetical protein
MLGTAPCSSIRSRMRLLSWARSAWTMQRRGKAFSRCSAARQSAACPGVSRKASGRPCRSVSAWTLVLRPPRLTLIAWKCAPFSTRCRAVGLHMRTVDQHLGRWPAFGRQRLEHVAPHALGRPAHVAIVERPFDKRRTGLGGP